MINIASKYLLSIILFFISFSLKALEVSKTMKDSLVSVHETDSAQKFQNYSFISHYYAWKNKNLQKTYLDSAKLYVDNSHNTPFSKVIYYYSWGNYYRIKHLYDSALTMYRKSLQYSNSSFIPEIVRINIGLGRAYTSLDQFDSAFYYYHKAINTYGTQDTSKKVQLVKAKVLNYIGSAYLNQGLYDSSVTYYYQALKIYDDNNERTSSSQMLMNIGNIYLFHKEYEKALAEYQNALHILNEINSPIEKSYAKIYSNMGLCYKALKQFDTAQVYYEKALTIREKNGPPRSLAGLYDNIGNLNKGQGKFDKALEYYHKSLEIRKTLNSPRWLAASYGNIGLMYYEMHDFSKAKKYLTKAVELSDKHGFVEISIECKRGLYRTYEHMGDYKKALKYLVEYRDLNDSIHSLKLEERLNEYKQKYESEKKDRLIEKLEEDKKLENAKNEKQQLLVEKQSMILNGLAVVAILLIFILIILQRYFKMKRKSDQELFAKNEQLNQQKTLELMKELEVGSIRSFAEGQEKERARIAGDLHDRLGSLLSTVKLHFSSLDTAIEENESAKKSYDFALQLLDNSVEEVREVSRNLSKGVLIQFGLIAAVENMRDAINSAGKIKMEVISTGVESRLDSEVEIMLFRVVQELITNVIRHSQTNEVFVQFSGAGSYLSIVVEDHGIGFDVEHTKSEGIGIENLKSRINSIGGEMTIDSVVGQGTTVIIEIPYLKDEGGKQESNDDK